MRGAANLGDLAPLGQVWPMILSAGLGGTERELNICLPVGEAGSPQGPRCTGKKWSGNIVMRDRMGFEGSETYFVCDCK